MSHMRQRATLWMSISAIASGVVLACGSPSGELGGSQSSRESAPESTSSPSPVPNRAIGDVTRRHPVRFDGGAGTIHDAGAPRDAAAIGDAAAPSTLDAADGGGGEDSASGGDGGSTEGGGGGVPALSLRVSGTHLVDATNAPIVLRGVDVSGTEFVCAQNYTSDPYGGAPLAAASTFEAMRAWNINVIRLPLNEDCWLDVNGVEVGGAAYQSAIEAEVTAAHAAGLFVILDLHWTAPGSQRALGQNPEPDADHSPAFWSSLASTFASDPGVIFDLFNEPFSYWGTDPDPWNGWLNGDVQTQYTTGDPLHDHCPMEDRRHAAAPHRGARRRRNSADPDQRPGLGERRLGMADPCAVRPPGPVDRGGAHLPGRIV